MKNQQEPVVSIDAQVAHEGPDGRLIWSQGETQVYTAGGLDPCRFDAQIVSRFIGLAANWAAGTKTFKGVKLARALRELLKEWEEL